MRDMDVKLVTEIGKMIHDTRSIEQETEETPAPVEETKTTRRTKK